MKKRLPKCLVNEWMNESMHKWMNRWMNKQTNPSANALPTDVSSPSSSNKPPRLLNCPKSPLPNHLTPAQPLPMQGHMPAVTPTPTWVNLSDFFNYSRNLSYSRKPPWLTRWILTVLDLKHPSYFLITFPHTWSWRISTRLTQQMRLGNKSKTRSQEAWVLLPTSSVILGQSLNLSVTQVSHL